jgi:hypothetical protein
MARLGRYFVEGQALQVIQRGNDRQAIFYAEGATFSIGTGWRNWRAQELQELGSD